MHCYLSPTWLANKRSIILSKSNVVLDANALVHHICHLHKGDGLIPCLFGDQMQLNHMSLITERKPSPTRIHHSTSYLAYSYTVRNRRCHLCVNDNIWIERPMGCHAIFGHQSSFLLQTLLLKDEECQRPVPPQHRRHIAHPSKRRARCSPVSPAAQRDEKTADPSLTTSPGWDTSQPPELNQASAEAAFGYFISSPSPYSLKIPLIYLTKLHARTQITFGI